jgi:hypothetical protein
MKWYHWLSIAICGFVTLRLFRNSNISSTPSTGYAGADVWANVNTPNGVPLTTAQAMTDQAAQDWNGGASLGVDDWRPADQDKYPGYYTTTIGGYYNPDTGASFSPGTSPPSVALSAEQQAANEAVNQAYTDAVNAGQTSGDAFNNVSDAEAEAQANGNYTYFIS